MMNLIIYSKDRPAQLYALLESMHMWWAKKYTPHIIFKASTTAFADGYKKVHKMTGYTLHEQTNGGIKLDTLVGMNPELPYTMFLVDDDVFIDTVNIEEEAKKLNDNEVIAVSLRLGRNIHYCYACDLETSTPKDLRFRWKDHKGDFGYPMSLDGNLFRTSDVSDAILKGTYYSPNDLEVLLQANKPARDYLIMQTSSKVVNLVVNRVQNVYQNRHANSYSPEDLNKEFLANKKIDIKPFMGLQPKSPHIETELYFTWAS